jgi:hypothetical protein
MHVFCLPVVGCIRVLFMVRVYIYFISAYLGTLEDGQICRNMQCTLQKEKKKKKGEHQSKLHIDGNSDT